MQDAPMTGLTTKKDRRNITLLMLFFLLSIFFLIFFAAPIFTCIGKFIVVDEIPTEADAIVVLYTGVDYYPRLIEAARLYREDFAKTIIINGNRKTDVLRRIEKKGFRPSCHWARDHIQILELYGVPEAEIVAVSAEDAFDTISEARAVGKAIIDKNIRSIILTTSKFHTRRAKHIWQTAFQGQIAVTIVAAKSDPYQPSGWWKEGRQIRWVMAEYGAWVYYLWHRLREDVTT